MMNLLVPDLKPDEQLPCQEGFGCEKVGIWTMPDASPTCNRRYFLSGKIPGSTRVPCC